MTLCMMPSVPGGTVTAPVSKSDAHRILICAALGNGRCVIPMHGSLSEDIRATVRCLTAMGAHIEESENGLTVYPIAQTEQTSFALDCGESGSTLRFLLPVAAALGRAFTVTGTGHLPDRPIGTALALLRENGCAITGNRLPLSVTGRLHGREFSLPGDVSSQYISGLLLALPLLGGGKITLTTRLQSADYVRMTVSCMEKFGCRVLWNENTLTVSGQYISPAECRPEGDWSNGAFWLAAGALGSGLTVTGLHENAVQGDRKILSVMREMGVGFTIKNDEITVIPNKLHNISVNASDIPDLVPILCVLMSTAEGTGEITDAGRLRLKESDRLQTTQRFLCDMGADIRQTADGLRIAGTGQLQGGHTESFNDHRIAMSAAVAACFAKNNTVLSGAQAVGKSYPDFWEIYRQAGGKYRVLSAR